MGPKEGRKLQQGKGLNGWLDETFCGEAGWIHYKIIHAWVWVWKYWIHQNCVLVNDRYMNIECNLVCFDTCQEAKLWQLLMENCNIITEILMKHSWWNKCVAFIAQIVCCCEFPSLYVYLKDYKNLLSMKLFFKILHSCSLSGKLFWKSYHISVSIVMLVANLGWA